MSSIKIDETLFFLQNKNILLHSCCAPCVCSVIETMISHQIKLTIIFYNPNIHPKSEYNLRKNENIRYAKKLNIPFIDCDYNVNDWFDRAKGMEYEPERGKRCTMCFDMRLERTALYAYENGYEFITSSLGISRWKNFEQINECGIRAANKYNIQYITHNWRKNNGSTRMYEISKQEHFYKQEYCGCIYSLRDAKKHKKCDFKEKKYYALD